MLLSTGYKSVANILFLPSFTGLMFNRLLSLICWGKKGRGQEDKRIRSR